ncbi:hypothetical protein [Paraburkholderia sp. J8-2]|uniref:hypothetical protein n=1 Tax=Paraburkholderia sp. J8-2 TaxID=2805440 RepID=UPI002AB7A985|nr:hypothetical protein [Paraburkholderia sp. J8-2]
MATWNNPCYSTAARPITDRTALNRRMHRKPIPSVANPTAAKGDHAYVSDVGPNKVTVRGVISSGPDANGFCKLDINPVHWNQAGCREITRPGSDFRVYEKGRPTYHKRRY